MVVEWSTVLWWIHVKWFPYSWNKNSHCWCWNIFILVFAWLIKISAGGVSAVNWKDKKNVLLHRSNMHKNFKCCFNMIHIRRILTSMEFRSIFSSLYRSSLLAWSRNNITFHYRVISIWCKYDVFISLTTTTEMPKIHNFHWRNTILTNSQFRRSFDTFGIVKYYTVKHEGKKPQQILVDITYIVWQLIS